MRSPHPELDKLKGLIAVEHFLERDDPNLDRALLNEREYVHNVIAVANARLPADIALIEKIYQEVTMWIRVQDRPQRPLREWELSVPAYREAQDLLRGWLETVMTAGTSAAVKLAPVLTIASRMVIRPKFTLRRAGGVDEQHRYYPVNLEAALAYGVVLLLDEKRPYGADLCRCKYIECGGYFLAVKQATGRPRRDYCELGHFKAARKAAAAQRIREYRRKLRAQARPRRPK